MMGSPDSERVEERGSRGRLLQENSLHPYRVDGIVGLRAGSYGVYTHEATTLQCLPIKQALVNDRCLLLAFLQAVVRR